MTNLDSKTEIKKIDKDDSLGSVAALADQIEETWEKFNKIKIPKSCSNTQQVVICGMGGSALGGRIIDAIMASKVKVPIETFTQYHVPNYVGPQTLAIISSYSGNTEEAVSMLKEAMKKKAQVFVVATGGKLAELAKEHNLPSFIYQPENNPAGQPRLALGYSITASLALLAKCGLIHLTDEDIAKVVKSTRKHLYDFGVSVPEDKNIAKKTARELKGKWPVLVASEHLYGAVHAFKNQINESAKTFSAIYDIPELNHHLLEGLKNPAEAKQYMMFTFFESKLYSSRVQRRYEITKDVVEKNEVNYISYSLHSETKLEQAFEVLAFGSYVQIYLAVLYGINPTPVPWVDYFKEKLAK